MISMLGDKRKRILLVDDHALVRQGLERLLNVGDEFVVCEEAGTAGHYGDPALVGLRTSIQLEKLAG